AAPSTTPTRSATPATPVHAVASSGAPAGRPVVPGAVGASLVDGDGAAVVAPGVGTLPGSPGPPGVTATGVAYCGVGPVCWAGVGSNRTQPCPGKYSSGHACESRPVTWKRV